MAEARGAPPDRVAKTVVLALTTRKPHNRYFVGADSRGAYLLGRILPSALRQWFMQRLLGLS